MWLLYKVGRPNTAVWDEALEYFSITDWIIIKNTQFEFRCNDNKKMDSKLSDQLKSELSDKQFNKFLKQYQLKNVLTR